MLIINGRIFTMEESLIECGFVRTKGNLIEEVGPMSVLSDKKNEKILDVRGAWVMPGLIDSHAHIGITEEKWGIIGDDSNEMTNPSTAALRAIDGINPMDPAFHDAIEAGITSVMAGPGSANVIGGQFVFMKTQGRCIDNMIVKYPAAMKIAFGENPKTTYGHGIPRRGALTELVSTGLYQCLSRPHSLCLATSRRVARGMQRTCVF